MNEADPPSGSTSASASRLRQLWSCIPGPNRRWLVVNALAVTAAVNVGVNLAIAWLGTRGVDSVPLWSTPLLRPSTVTDTLGTTFMLPFVTAITTGVALRSEIRRGRVLPLPLDCEARRLTRGLPRGRIRRALWIATGTVVVVGPVILLGLAAARFDDVSVHAFLLYKVAYAVVLGLLVTPVIAVAAMTQDESLANS
jgi:hypothetical protein